MNKGFITFLILICVGFIINSMFRPSDCKKANEYAIKRAHEYLAYGEPRLETMRLATEYGKKCECAFGNPFAILTCD